MKANTHPPELLADQKQERNPRNEGPSIEWKAQTPGLESSKQQETVICTRRDSQKKRTKKDRGQAHKEANLKKKYVASMGTAFDDR